MVYSLCDYSVLTAPRWVGRQNFVELFSDEVFWGRRGIRSSTSRRLGGTQWHYLMAASVLTTAPLVVLIFLLQRYFLHGLGSMKSID